MVFYVSLFVVCSVAAGLTVWLVRALTRVGKAYYRAILPSTRQNLNDENPELVHLSADIDKIAAPWGWANSGKPRQVKAVPQTAPRPGPIPWGWPGNPHVTLRGVGGHGTDLFHIGHAAQARSDWLRHVGSRSTGTSAGDERPQPVLNGANGSGPGWPDREDSFVFGGRTYRYERAVQPRAPSGKLVKPWGW